MSLISMFMMYSLLFLGQATASFYPCPSPPAPGEMVMSLKDAYSPQLQLKYAQGWYYAVGTLCELGFGSGIECTSPLAYQLITYMYNTSQTGKNVIVSPAVVSITDNSGHYEWAGTGNPVGFPTPHTNPFNLNFTAPANNVSINFENTGFLPTGTLGSSYIFTASAPNVSMNLYLLSLSPTMWQGTGGYSGFPNSTVCTGYYYVSMPQLYTVGTITFNNRKYLVSGKSWFDHEWGGVLPGTSGGQAGKNGWDWFGLRFGSTSIMALVVRQNNVYLVGGNSTVDVQLAGGTMVYGKVSALEVISTWTSPSTGVVYPVELSLNTTVSGYEYLLISPVFLDQEVGAGKSHYWEGYVMVESPTTIGEGYLELTGFQF